MPTPLPFLTLLLLLLVGCAPTTNDHAEEPALDTTLQLSRAFVTQLQGTWQRVDYPYSTVEFKDQSVLFRAGEGVIESPTFKPFTLDNACPGAPAQPHGGWYLVYSEPSVCDWAKIVGDTLLLGDAKGTAHSTYKKS